MNILNTLPDRETYDVVVVGAGGAGMAAALFAAIEGARVLLIERTGFVGGTTARSAGTTWVPGTHHAAQVNPQDTLADAARYLDNAVGERSPSVLRQSFLSHGAAAIAHLESNSAVRFRPYAKHPDYISDLGGSTLCGRALEPMPFDGRLLGERFRLIRPPIPEFTVLGGMMVDRSDINHLLGMLGSWASFAHAVRIVMRHGLDRLRYPRGTRLVMGNALVGRLLYSLMQRANVTLALNTTLDELHSDADGVQSVRVRQGDRRCVVDVKQGVVMASGGFNRNPARRQTLLPGVDVAWCPGAPGHTGEALDLACAAGAAWGLGGLSHAFWAPVSLRMRADGSQAVFPHFVMDRAKPGFITVNGAGERFVNESTSYHLFGLAMQRTDRQHSAIPAFLICDATALRKYGIGMVRPGGKGLGPFLADGYLTTGATLQELAQKLGIPPDSLCASVATLNAYAQTGIDPDFHRGETAYQQNIGDPAWTGRNPSLGALETGPYYAVKLYPGDIGAATGLVADTHARVQDEHGNPIPGLYVVGNDMNSIMAGVYTAPGITIGPGLVFAYLAAKDAVTRPRV